MRRLIFSSVVTLVLQACTSAGSSAKIPAAPQEPITYVGSGPDDVWTVGSTSSGAGALRHYAGSAWSEPIVTPKSPLGSVVSVAPGSVLATATEITDTWHGYIYKIDGSGTATDVTPALPMLVRNFQSQQCRGTLSVQRGKGGIVAIFTTVDCLPNLFKMYRWDGSAFVDMAVNPPVVSPSNFPWNNFQATAVMFGPDDMWFGTSVDPWKTPLREMAACVHFDGTNWQPVFSSGLTSIPCGLGIDHVVFQGFPKELPVVGSAVFDGARFQPLGVPNVNGRNDNVYFWTKGGRLGMIAEFSGTGSTPVVYQDVLDANGNVTGQVLVDTRGSVDMSYAVLEWDKQANTWLKTSVIGTGKACVGIACAYGGGTGARGVRGSLTDGSLVVQINEALDTAGSSFLYIVTP